MLFQGQYIFLVFQKHHAFYRYLLGKLVVLFINIGVLAFIGRIARSISCAHG
jgi:hypothetical protein